MIKNYDTIILIDGQCVLCNRLTQFLIPHDPKGRIRFGALQSEAGKQLLEHAGLANDSSMSSVILIQNGKAYAKSTAVLRVLRVLNGGWYLLYGLIIVPRPLRDIVYDWFAARRYRWFGRTESCMLPPAAYRTRFIVDDDMPRSE